MMGDMGNREWISYPRDSLEPRGLQVTILGRTFQLKEFQHSLCQDITATFNGWALSDGSHREHNPTLVHYSILHTLLISTFFFF